MDNQKGKNYHKEEAEKEGRKGKEQVECKSEGLDNFGDSSGNLLMALAMRWSLLVGWLVGLLFCPVRLTLGGQVYIHVQYVLLITRLLGITFFSFLFPPSFCPRFLSK